MPKAIDWSNLDFDYIDTGAIFRADFRDGAWGEGYITSNSSLELNVAAPVLHYGQAVFEGMKAYRRKDGQIQLFRPDMNAQRMTNSAKKLEMVPYPEDKFVEAIHQVVAANAEWVPPYESGATLYIRPTLIGAGSMTKVSPAEEYIFAIYVTPVGPYFPEGMQPAHFVVSSYDRAAPRGTGSAKAGGNYASSFKATLEAKAQGYSDVIFLDPMTHAKIEEVGAANFFGITEDQKFVTPDSDSILPGVTRDSLMELAKHRLNLEVEMGDVTVDQLDQFVEAGACGTAAVITPLGSITFEDQRYKFYSDTKIGPITQKLYDELTGIQYGDIAAPKDWVQIVEID